MARRSLRRQQRDRHGAGGHGGRPGDGGPLAARLTAPPPRTRLHGPGVRALNRGGWLNPDVLLVESPDGSCCVVKDYALRSAPVRRFVAPWLVRRELRILQRLEGVRGVPRPLGRVDRLAFAMEYIDGLPLSRRAHGGRLPPRFFAQLREILEQIAARGLVYLDLRSPTNVLARPGGEPALVDLASAVRLPLPAAARRSLERRAIDKLRRRFEVGEDGEPVDARPPAHVLKLPRTRIAWRESGPLSDPVPLLCLHDRPGAGDCFAPWLARAGEEGRRLLAPDLPGFGDSRRSRRDLDAGRVATLLAGWLRAMRVERVDVVGLGWGGEVALSLPGALVRHRTVLDADSRGELPTWPR